ncbi:MAG: DUF4835 family protein [Bacteroidetes bacterium]|nr:DUF4835 family protein [Bacteroidota bacterium]
MRKFIFNILLFLLPVLTFAQEFNCNVQVSAPQIQGTDRSVYDNLRTALYEFINNRTWTNYSFKPEERIECSIIIVVSERISQDEFKGTINIQLRRPIFHTSYNTVMLNFVDNDFQFKYTEFQTLDFVENSFTSNLTAVVAFYCYTFLGIDFDSYSLYGGSPYFEKAQNIVNLAQNAPEKGWKSFESQKNRYWIIENLLNSAYNSVRQASYRYHRLGLDAMYDNLETGRTAIAESIDLLKKAYREKPGLYSIQLFMGAKSDEIINIFSKAAQQDKVKVINNLIEVDPANASKYQGMLNKN